MTCKRPEMQYRVVFVEKNEIAFNQFIYTTVELYIITKEHNHHLLWVNFQLLG